MAVRSICLFPDAALSQPCAPVADFRSPSLQKLVRDLIDTMNDSPGVGLAAPQIGVLEQVSVIDVRRVKKKGEEKNHGLVVLINPRLIRGEGVQVPREGCLSVPDLLANVQRFNNVTVHAQTEDGSPVIYETRGFEALAFQHEIDHLQGRLFLDRVSNLKTDVFRRKNY